MADIRLMNGDASVVADARAIVRQLMSEKAPEARDVAILLTDELVTNAIVHGGGTFRLTAELEEDCLRVEVGDSSRTGPRILGPSADREHGRGIAIVEALASSWGSQQNGGGKLVWFELDLRSWA